MPLIWIGLPVASFVIDSWLISPRMILSLGLRAIVLLFHLSLLSFNLFSNSHFILHSCSCQVMVWTKALMGNILTHFKLEFHPNMIFHWCLQAKFLSLFLICPFSFFLWYVFSLTFVLPFFLLILGQLCSDHQFVLIFFSLNPKPVLRARSLVFYSTFTIAWGPNKGKRSNESVWSMS